MDDRMAYFKPAGLTDNIATNSNRKVEKEYKLYVKNIPVELDEVGLRDVFKRYGAVTSILNLPNSDWAYITYGTYREAENAIRNLNASSPLHLKVSFALERRDNRQSQQKAEIPEGEFSAIKKDGNIDDSERLNDSEPRYRYPNGPGVNYGTRGNTLQSLINTNIPPRVPIHSYCTEDDLLYVPFADPRMYNPYENAEPFSDTNTLWTSGHRAYTRDGKRLVSLGRGYTCYDIPSRPAVRDQISKVYEKRLAALYEYGENKLKDDIGNCQYCSKTGRCKCQRCLGFYCDRECQAADWPRHKFICQEMPSLIKAAEPLSHSNNEDVRGNSRVTKYEGALRRPKSQVDAVAEEGNKTSVTDVKIINSSEDVREVPSPKQNKQHDQEQRNNTEEVAIPESVEYTGSNNSHNKNFKSNLRNSKGNYSPAQHNNIRPQDRTNKQQDSPSATHGKQNNRSEFGSINESDNSRFNTNRQMSGDSRYNNRYSSEDSRSTGAGKGFPSVNKKRNDNRSEVNIVPKTPVPNSEDSNAQSDFIKTDKGFSFQKDDFLSKNKFTDLKIVFREADGIYWAQKIENENDLIQMMRELNDLAAKNNLPTVERPVSGNIYAAKFDGVWHRVLLKCVKPAKVLYIDYGNEEHVDLKELLELEKYCKQSYFARKIKVADDSSEKYKMLQVDDMLSVKMFKVDDDGAIVVQVRGDQNENPFAPLNVLPINVSNKTQTERFAEQTISNNQHKKMENSIDVSSKKLQSIVELLMPGTDGMLEIHAQLQSNIFAATAITNSLVDLFVQILQEFPEVCNKMPRDSSFSPKVGDLICGERGTGDWLRGYVVNLGPPLRLAAIDEGRVEVVDDIRRIDKKFANICTFGVTCELLDTAHTLKPRDKSEFTVISCDKTDAGVNVKIMITTADDARYKAVLRYWKPMAEQKGVPYSSLSSGSEVCLTTYRSQSLMYARSLKLDDLKYYHKVIHEVAKASRTAHPLSTPPVVGQMVIAKYIDDNFYRAIVTEVQGEKIGVSYVDYGNVDYTTLNKLKILPDSLKEYNCCTSKIVLKDVLVDAPMTKEANTFLTQLVAEETALICNFEGLPTVQGVELKLPVTGESINEKINRLLIPNWKKRTEEDGNTSDVVLPNFAKMRFTASHCGCGI
ncbi:uncharacterized protein LOC105698585 isoform X2 [Orussus abietinus]|uniref:uncharacterized protein LOC105698585 isoform X2 n=1 Tax=Orussus abietinus TaxID=222816 RepID=UPI0006252E96|nr:uncharacterized protein LOC105698585 isoform X2 [Orussus abietinus]